ncbi:MAG: sugar ABC transporter permease [Actinomycetota bacterium]
METLAATGGEETSAEEREHPPGDLPPRDWRYYGSRVAVAAIVVGLVIWAIFEPKIRSTVITVVVAVAASGAIWVGANLLFNQVRNRWPLFNAIAYGLIGFIGGVLLHGNLITVGSGRGFFTWVVGPLIAGVVLGGIGYVLSITDDPVRRRLISIGSAAAIGVVVGLLIREQYHPEFDALAIAVYTVVLGGLGAGLGVLRKRPPLGGALTGATIGWVLGAWGGADLGGGNAATSIVATLVPALLIGYRIGMTHNPDYQGRVEIDGKSRAVIFVGPALLFITIALIVPAIRTAYLSLLDNDSEGFVGLENYGAIFTDEDSFNASGWTNTFTSQPFIIGMVLLVIALIVGFSMRQRTGKAVELGNPTMPPLVVGGLLVCFGVFTAFRGTIINNLWWVVTVVFLSTALGLAVAVLADQKGGEKFAKSIIFMPMAISLVGASVIWRFVYTARDTSAEQTGVMNALWVGLGNLSTGSGLPTIIASAILGLILIGCFILLAQALTRRQWGKAVVPGICVLLGGWFFIRFTGLIGGGVGGFTYEDGVAEPQTVFFVQETPYNNFWLMVILIWIQTGFSMVILSAAIKAVPTELIEAARIDGATESQVFWRVTLPQISTTIGVVVTTLIVLVMKVYDIVKVVTNGQFDTQVLANDMFQESFSFLNTGVGAALAILIFVSVVPVMFYNIRRMQQEN